jgi:hypothetical protein
MARIAILERADMNTEQTRVYDAAKQLSGIARANFSPVRASATKPMPLGKRLWGWKV